MSLEGLDCDPGREPEPELGPALESENPGMEGCPSGGVPEKPRGQRGAGGAAGAAFWSDIVVLVEHLCARGRLLRQYRSVFSLLWQ